MRFTAIQHSIPQTVGRAKAIKVQTALPVSLRMVMSVVEHGKCITVKIIVQTAVVIVQPLAVSIS